nr:amidohydrolase family protein [Frankia sp. Cas3]
MYAGPSGALRQLLLPVWHRARDPTVPPGTLKEMLKQMASGNPEGAYTFEPMRPEYQDREARRAKMAEQNVQGAVMFSGGWSLFAEEYLDDTDALYAKLVLMPVGPAGGRSPGDPYFDPIYSRIHEAGASIAFHITEHWFNSHIAPAWGHHPAPMHFRMAAWQWMNTYGMYPIVSTISALIFDNLFGRFPHLQCLIAEFGAAWVPLTLSQMDKSRGMGRNGPWIGGTLPERPSEVFRQHVKVVPYPEDDTVALVHQIGHADCFVMGSDFPHAEGLAEPRVEQDAGGEVGEPAAVAGPGDVDEVVGDSRTFAHRGGQPPVHARRPLGAPAGGSSSTARQTPDRLRRGGVGGVLCHPLGQQLVVREKDRRLHDLPAGEQLRHFYLSDLFRSMVRWISSSRIREPSSKVPSCCRSVR